MSELQDIVAKFRKASPNIAAAFDEVERRLIALEQPVPPVGSWPPIDMTPAPFTPVRTTQIVTANAFRDVYLNARDGDRLVCSGFSFTSQVNLNRRFTGQGIEINFEMVLFGGDPLRNQNAAFVTGTRHRLFGGVLSNPAGHGILVYPSDDILWHGFTVNGVGGTCLRVFAVNGDVSNLDLYGELSDCGNDLSLDVHQEKGTGVHPFYGGGDESQTGTVRNSRFVLDTHDCDTGSNQIGGKAQDNQFYFRAERLNKVAVQQVAGNAVQLFGQKLLRNRIWVEADDVAKVVDTNGLGAGSSGNVVWHGRGTNVRQQPKYMPHSGVTYQDCT